ncbi:MAG: NUDIX hydrolase [Alphaproteobacteria bacterium]|nr:MAG: NUDIX hydrolase [Alphaproteobacteria bacterium]
MDAFKKHLADVVILTSGGKILLQQRPMNWKTNPGGLNLFGGHVEDGEEPIEAAVREIHEETGGVMHASDLLFIGTLTEGWTNHTEAVHIYFWHDERKTITGCYEAEAVEFDSFSMAINQPSLMAYAKWALEECKRRGLIPSSD